MKKKRKFLFTILVFSIFAFVFILLAIVDFYIILQKKEEQLQQDLLYDLSVQSSAFLDIKLEGYIDTLYGLAAFISGPDFQSDENMEHMKKVKEKEEFLRVGIISSEGILKTTDGNEETEVDVSDRIYWKHLKEKTASISEVRDSRITDDRVFFVAVPLLDAKGEFKGGLHAAIDINDFQVYAGTRLGVTNYNIYLIDSEGDYVIRCKKHEKSWDYSSFFDYFEENGQDLNLEDLRLQMQNRAILLDTIKIEDERYLVCFSPLLLNNWYTVVTIPQEEVKHHISMLLDKNMTILVIKILGTLGILCCIIVYYGRKEAVQEKDKEIQIREKLFTDIEGFIQADLIEDRVIYCSDSLKLNKSKNPTYTEKISYYIKNNALPEYHEKLLQASSTQQLVEMNSKGINRISQEYMVNGKKETDIPLWYVCEMHVEENMDTGHPCVYYVIKNIDEKKRMEQTLKTKAERDSLTGLYNRSAATNLINQALRSDETQNNKTSNAFIILDLDNFKTLNDTLLHKTGDKALQDVSKILLNYFRKGDIICRLGGDEFVVFLKNTPLNVVKEKLTPLLKKLHLSYERDGKKVDITASVGVAMCPECGTKFSSLYQAADQALYQAKREGKATFCVYTPSDEMKS